MSYRTVPQFSALHQYALGQVGQNINLSTELRSTLALSILFEVNQQGSGLNSISRFDTYRFDHAITGG